MRAFRKNKKQRQEEKAIVIAHIVKESIEKLRAEEDEESKNMREMRQILFRGKDGTQKTMWNLIVKKKMPPTRFCRYCCAE